MSVTARLAPDSTATSLLVSPIAPSPLIHCAFADLT